jgi:hypothetical protein
MDKWPFEHDGQIPNFRVIRERVSTGYSRVERNRRASRNGPVSVIPLEIPHVTISQLFHRCRDGLAGAHSFTWSKVYSRMRDWKSPSRRRHTSCSGWQPSTRAAASSSSARLMCTLNSPTQRWKSLRIAKVWHGATENDGQIPNVRGVRERVSTGYHRVEGNRRASRNGRVSDLPPETTPHVTTFTPSAFTTTQR